MHQTLSTKKKSGAAATNGNGPTRSRKEKTTSKRAAAPEIVSDFGEVIASIEETKSDAARRSGVAVGKLTSLPAKAQSAAAQGAGYQILAIKRIGRSPLNRAEFSEGSLQELAADLKIRGILQPLIVRKNPGYTLEHDPDHGPSRVLTHEGTDVSGPLPRNLAVNLHHDLSRPEYELIAGERRWRAAQIAGLAEAPVIVRVANDREALEDQAVENLHREDLNPIHEAEKYQQLLAAYKRDGVSDGEAIELLCEKVQRSKALVYERLRLLKLPEAARTAGLAGRLPGSHLGLIAKIEDPDAAAEVTEAVLNPDERDIDEDEIEERDGEPLVAKLLTLSFRDTKRLVSEKLAELERRREYNRKKAEFEAAGLRVLSPEENLNAFAHDWSRYPEDNSGFVGAEEGCRLDKRWRKWRECLGAKAPALILGQQRDGTPVEMYSRTEAEAILRKKQGSKPGRASTRPESELRAEREHKARVKLFAPLLGSVAAAAEALDSPDIWKFIAQSAIHRGGSDCIWHVVKRRFPEAKRDTAYKVVEAWAAKANGKELRGLVAEIFFAGFAPSHYSGGWGKGFEDACYLFGVTPPAWKIQTSGKEGNAE